VYICLYNRLWLVVFVFARLEVVVVVGRSVATRSTPSWVRIERFEIALPLSSTGVSAGP